MADSGDVVKLISDNLEKVFRHMLPGVFVLLAAYWSHRHWFAHVDFSGGGHLTMLTAIALAVGNAWYVAHRYSMHQFIDWTSYLRVVEKPRARYADWLSDHITRSFKAREKQPSVSDHLHMRSSHIIFLFITCEIAFAFSFGADDCSFFHHNALCIRLVSVLGAIAAFVQQHLTFKIDVKIASKLGEPTASSEPKPTAL